MKQQFSFSSNNKHLIKQVPQLKAQGMNQRDIAKQLGVTEKTVSQWIKAMPINDYEIIRKAMITRLKALTENPETPIREITDLTNSLASIEKAIQKLE